MLNRLEPRLNCKAKHRKCVKKYMLQLMCYKINDNEYTAGLYRFRDETCFVLNILLL